MYCSVAVAGRVSLDLNESPLVAAGCDGDDVAVDIRLAGSSSPPHCSYRFQIRVYLSDGPTAAGQ